MKKEKFFFIFLLSFFLFILSSCFAANEANETNDYESYESFVVDIMLIGNSEFISQTKLISTLNLVPLEDKRQEIISFEIIGNADSFERGKEKISYSWSSTKNATFGYKAKIKTKFLLEEITFQEFPSVFELEEFTKATEHADINDEIIKKANSLAEGKKDLFEVVHEIAKFVHYNMEYDEAYTEKIEKASSILKNKRGVCDEYTILFISLVRALNIPARYVSGVAYSNIKKDFGNHAWAEVFFPDHGWVPFDPTYGQFGWIDASHIALSKTADAENSVTYVYYTEMMKQELKIETKISEKGNKLNGKIFMKISPLRNEISSNSYLPLKIETKNPFPYYLPLAIYLTKAPGVYGKNFLHILQKPKSEKISFLILKIPDAEEGYIYTARLEAKNQFNDFAESSIKFSLDYEHMNLEKALELAKEIEEQDFVYEIKVKCDYEKEIYIGDIFVVSCNITSKSNIFLELSVCLEKCKSLDLPIGFTIQQNFSLLAEKSDYIFEIKNIKNNATKKEHIFIKLLKKPDPKIITEQKILKYKKDFLNFTAETKSTCRDVLIEIENLKIREEKLEGKKTYRIAFAGKKLMNKKLHMKISCYDLKKRKYEKEELFDLAVVEIPWYAKIWEFFSKIF